MKEQKYITIYLKVLLGLAVIFTTTWLSFFGAVQATAFLAACCMVFLMCNFKSISRIKYGDLEADLQHKIEQANATLEQLRELAASLAQPTLGLIASQGYLGAFPISYRFEVAARIKTILQNIEVSEDRINEINSLFMITVRNIIAVAITKGLNQIPRNEKDAVRLGEGASIGRMGTPEDYESLLTKYSLLTPERQELIEDLRFFIENHELRRPEFWDDRVNN
jgi:hypothetical protein